MDNMSRLPLEEIFELPSEPLTESQRQELERRWRAFEQSPDEGEPGEDVRTTVLDD